jgi:hypothetical protein
MSATRLWQAMLLLTSMQLSAQVTSIGIIDTYGLRSIPEEQVRQALRLSVGDKVPDSLASAQKRLEAIGGVSAARLTATCCAAGKVILFVGIEEKGAPAIRFRSEPAGAIKLPRQIQVDGEEYYKAVREAVEKGDAAEDHSLGHALMRNPAARKVQERFVSDARELASLRDVLHNAASAQQRSLAALVLGYAADKRAVAAELQYAMLDSDSGVRNSAMRALWIIAEYGQKHPDLGIQIDSQAFVQMLNSLVWTDRNKAAAALMTLSESRDPALLANLRAQALPALIEMARWKSAGHALSAYMMLGRLAGLADADITAAWERGDREPVIAAARKLQSGDAAR